ncbi:MAG: transposase domain-containing protein, partial [Armatimonadota bacterium]
PRGARTSAVVHSLVETASENGLNPLDYLRFALERLGFIDSATDLRESSEVMDSLLPWAESVKSALQPQPPPPLDQVGLS